MDNEDTEMGDFVATTPAEVDTQNQADVAPSTSSQVVASGGQGDEGRHASQPVDLAPTTRTISPLGVPSYAELDRIRRNPSIFHRRYRLPRHMDVASVLDAPRVGPGSLEAYPLPLQHHHDLLKVANGTWVRYAGQDPDWWGNVYYNKQVWPVFAPPEFVVERLDDGSHNWAKRLDRHGPCPYSWEAYHEYFQHWRLPMDLFAVGRNGATRPPLSVDDRSPHEVPRWPQSDLKGAYRLHPRYFNRLEYPLNLTDKATHSIFVHPFPYRVDVQPRHPTTSTKYQEPLKWSDTPWKSWRLTDREGDPIVQRPAIPEVLRALQRNPNSKPGGAGAFRFLNEEFDGKMVNRNYGRMTPKEVFDYYRNNSKRTEELIRLDIVVIWVPGSLAEKYLNAYPEDEPATEKPHMEIGDSNQNAASGGSNIDGGQPAEIDQRWRGVLRHATSDQCSTNNDDHVQSCQVNHSDELGADHPRSWAIELPSAPAQPAGSNPDEPVEPNDTSKPDDTHNSRKLDDPEDSPNLDAPSKPSKPPKPGYKPRIFSGLKSKPKSKSRSANWVPAGGFPGKPDAYVLPDGRRYDDEFDVDWNNRDHCWGADKWTKQGIRRLANGVRTYPCYSNAEESYLKAWFGWFGINYHLSDLSAGFNADFAERPVAGLFEKIKRMTGQTLGLPSNIRAGTHKAPFRGPETEQYNRLLERWNNDGLLKWRKSMPATTGSKRQFNSGEEGDEEEETPAPKKKKSGKTSEA